MWSKPGICRVVREIHYNLHFENCAPVRAPLATHVDTVIRTSVITVMAFENVGNRPNSALGICIILTCQAGSIRLQRKFGYRRCQDEIQICLPGQAAQALDSVI